jgi:hypothetical protein
VPGVRLRFPSPRLARRAQGVVSFGMGKSSHRRLTDWSSATIGLSCFLVWLVFVAVESVAVLGWTAAIVHWLFLEDDSDEWWTAMLTGALLAAATLAWRAAHRQIEATQKAAQAGLRPVIVLSADFVPETMKFQITARNIGPGPALTILIFVKRQFDGATYTRVVDAIAPGASGTVEIQLGTDNVQWYRIEGSTVALVQLDNPDNWEPTHGDVSVEVSSCTYQDVFDNAFVTLTRSFGECHPASSLHS